jgi:hypothetical protein
MGRIGPHTANRTCDWLRIYSWQVKDHPSYSPEFVLGDFHYSDGFELTVWDFGINGICQMEVF